MLKRLIQSLPFAKRKVLFFVTIHAEKIHQQWSEITSCEKSIIFLRINPCKPIGIIINLFWTFIDK